MEAISWYWLIKRSRPKPGWIWQEKAPTVCSSEEELLLPTLWEQWALFCSILGSARQIINWPIWSCMNINILNMRLRSHKKSQNGGVSPNHSKGCSPWLLDGVLLGALSFSPGSKESHKKITKMSFSEEELNGSSPRLLGLFSAGLSATAAHSVTL